MLAPFFALIKLCPDQAAQLAFHDGIMLVRVIHYLTTDLDVLLERIVAGVDHDAGEPLVHAVLAQLEGIPVVEVDRNGDIGQADRCFD